jgi:hypothetical protein
MLCILKIDFEAYSAALLNELDHSASVGELRDIADRENLRVSQGSQYVFEAWIFRGTDK